MTQSSTSTADRLAVQLYVGLGIAVFALMMLVGVLMRATQGAWVALPADRFYEAMTLHGAGMVGTAGLAGAVVMWYFLRQYVRLSSGIFLGMLALSLAGVVAILVAILVGRFAAGWTFLFPLPAKSLGVWPAWSAGAFVLGLVLIGVGFLLFYADAAIAVVRRYGSLVRSLGLPQLLSGRSDEAPPATVVASTMVIIVNVIGILAGAVVLVMTLVHLFIPAAAFDALLMKNLIYFFGHVFINATIYMAVIAVYELLPRYSGRPWKVSRPFLAAWAAATLMVIAVYPHHLLMDFVMPRWAAVFGQVFSFLSAVPVILVTAWGTLANVFGSGIRWNSASRLLYLGVLGWAAGVIPAAVDGTIAVNKVMHNTLWVPGHFHLYLLLGLVPLVLGFASHVFRGEEATDSAWDRAAFWAYTVGGAAFCLSFLYGGMNAVPRRFAEHFPEWAGVAQVGTLAAVLALVGVLWLGARVLARIGSPQFSPAATT